MKPITIEVVMFNDIQSTTEKVAVSVSMIYGSVMLYWCSVSVRLIEL